MPKPLQTKEQKQLRITAYEMYLKGHMDQGRKLSFRSIAMALGVTDTAVRYWWNHDRWDQRIDSALTQRTVATTRGNKAISNLLRSSLYQNMVVLNTIIADPARPDGVRIKAISEFADICLKLKVIQPDDLLQTPTSAATPTFKDDLNGHVDGRTPSGRDGSDAVLPATAADAVFDHDDPAIPPRLDQPSPSEHSALQFDGSPESPAYGYHGDREPRVSPSDGDESDRPGSES